MKMVLIVIACVAGGWYWFVGSRQISASEIESFYRQENEWFTDQKTKEMCAGLDDKYFQRTTQTSSVGRTIEEVDKAGACQAMTELVESVTALRSKFGAQVGVHIQEDVGQIQISEDKKGASVHVKSVFTMGIPQAQFVKISSEMDETFIKRNGKILRLRAEGTSTIE